MTTTAKVAICIPTYNQAPYLERAVRSAVAQTYPCEVWVSDDASTDETPEIMARLVREYPRIRHIRHQENMGIQGNPRWTLQQPSTEYIVRLDSDDELHPGYVEKLRNNLAAHPLAGYAHAAVQEIDSDGQKQRLRLLARGAGFQSGKDSLRASVTGYRVAANILLFRRSALEEVDYYRPGLSFAEDWDLAVRLADAGWGNIYVNEVLANYRVWETAGQLRSRRKLSEIEGCRRVFDDSLTPAFSRRNWSLATISVARRRMAARHAVCLRSNLFNDAERRNLKTALCELGDSLALRWKFCWIDTPLAPLFQLPANVIVGAKAAAKTMLFNRHN